ncbi:uncharacterized protein LOC133900533 isoform X2 [Phragmites australis]|uniref:uncharacterized protein LOC133900533 isoform X2 n=1 Tax=Phragmites australis TaxID=29695 RepID=UPI002D78D9AD|nr:uncharacterized protein LOC133900533 isoform X2 [Phragmites australis]
MENPIASCADLETSTDRSMALSSPALPGTDSVAPNSAWILLDQEAYIDVEDRENATTAEVRTSSGQSVKVSFFAAEPPRLSHFCVHCPGLTTTFDFLGWPCILHSVDNLALIRVAFAFNTEYFFYRAGRGRRPSLEHLRDIGSYLSKVPFVPSIGILPCGAGDDFVLAALGFTLVAGQCELHIFRSERGTWTRNILPGKHRLNIEKVIVLGDGKLGFVDMWKEILVCDVLKENPTTSFIPLPKLLPNNQSDDHMCFARMFRDVVACMDGSIKCVEVEACSRCVIHIVPKVSSRRMIHDELLADVSNTDVLHDSDLMPDCVADIEVEDTEEEDYEYLGWRIISWSRAHSSTCWRKESLFHADDIRVNNPIHNAMLGDLGGSGAHLKLKDLFISVPTVSMDDSSALYLISKVDPTDQELCVLMVDMGKKTLEEFSPVLTQRPDFFKPTCIPCALSKYLNTDSDGTQVGGKNASWPTSSTLQPTKESFTECITPSDHYPRAQYYSDYRQQQQAQEVGCPLPPITPFEAYYRQEQPRQSPPLSWSRSALQPTEESFNKDYGGYHYGPPHAFYQQEQPRAGALIDVTRIGGKNASQSASSTLQPLPLSEGSDNNIAAVSGCKKIFKGANLCKEEKSQEVKPRKFIQFGSMPPQEII